MSTGTTAPRIRELMPANHLGLLAAECGLNNVRYLQQVIALENAAYKNWPAVVALAEKTNPEGYKLWAAANPTKVPAPAAA